MRFFFPTVRFIGFVTQAHKSLAIEKNGWGFWRIFFINWSEWIWMMNSLSIAIRIISIRTDIRISTQTWMGSFISEDSL